MKKMYLAIEDKLFGFGYGTGEQYTLQALKGIMNNLNSDKRTYDFELFEQHLTPTIAWLMINALCRVDIFDYGTSPRFGWLSEKGEELRDFLEKHTIDELCEILNNKESV